MINLQTLKAAACGALLAAGICVAGGAHATTVYPATTEDLAHIADLVVVGEVQSVHSQYEAASITDARTTMRTHNKVKVLQTWKGDAQPGDVIDVVELGGTVAGHVVELQGAPGYKLGERVLLFLQPKKMYATRAYLTLGVFLGKYSLIPNGQGGWNVTRLHWSMAARGTNLDLNRDVKARALSGVVDLASFATQVKKVIADDKAAHVDGKWLPKYDHMGVGR